MIARFSIPYPQTPSGRAAWSKTYSLNAIYAGKHWIARQRDSVYWHGLVHSELQRQELYQIHFNKPVEVSFWWNDRLDLDNHAYIAKMIVDALKGVWIDEDDRRHVTGISYHWGDGDCIVVEVREAVGSC